MPRIRTVILLASLACSFAAVAGESQPAAKPAEAAAAQIWGPKIGEMAPGGELLNRTGEPVKIESLYGKGPVVVIFYRGSWCPYCTKSLRAWDEKMSEFTAAGATIIAISPEKAGYASQMTNAHELDFQAYSDAKGDVCRNYNVLFNVSEEIKTKYKSYKIDLADRNADGEWSLPHPATIVIDKGGVVRNVWVDEDYTKRVEPDIVLAALKSLPQ
jgi:peroxiredoxin